MGGKRVVLLGATGGTGRATLARLLALDGWTAVAVVRTPAALDGLKASLSPDAAARLEVVKGDLLGDDAAVRLGEAFRGADAVVFAAGVATIKQAATQKTTIYSVGGKNMLDAMAAAGVRRLVAVTSTGVHDSPHAAWVYRFFIRPVLMGQMYADMRELERQINEAAAPAQPGGAPRLVPTILRPSRLMDAPVHGGTKQPVVVESEDALPRGVAHEVDRADLADLIVKALQDEDSHAGKTLTITA